VAVVVILVPAVLHYLVVVTSHPIAGLVCVAGVAGLLVTPSVADPGVIVSGHVVRAAAHHAHHRHPAGTEEPQRQHGSQQQKRSSTSACAAPSRRS
jgi:hypothetical protein